MAQDTRDVGLGYKYHVTWQARDVGFTYKQQVAKRNVNADPFGR